MILWQKPQNRYWAAWKRRRRSCCWWKSMILSPLWMNPSSIASDSDQVDFYFCPPDGVYASTNLDSTMHNLHTYQTIIWPLVPNPTTKVMNTSLVREQIKYIIWFSILVIKWIIYLNFFILLGCINLRNLHKNSLLYY